jgi:hypothetical protein
MTWTGKLGVGWNQRAPIPKSTPDGKKITYLPTVPRPKDEVELPFVIEMQRPRNVWFELLFKGQIAVQVYDGASGWKLRP